MKHFFCTAFILVLSIGGLFLTGCGENARKGFALILGALKSGVAQNMQPSNPPDNRPYHEKFNWKPEDYFNDPLVIELCRAIEKQDIALVDKLIAEGADANALGKGNMTLLLWANSVGNVDVFAKILKAGADPNIQFESAFGTEYPQFRPGDPTDSHIKPGETILQSVITMQGGLSFLNEIKRDQLSDVALVRKIRLLADAGVDLNPVDKNGRTPLLNAINYQDYGFAIALIDAGADWKNVEGASCVLVLLQHKTSFAEFPGTMKGSKYASYLELMNFLREKGRDFDEELEFATLCTTDTKRLTFSELHKLRAEIAQKKIERRERIERQKRAIEE